MSVAKNGPAGTGSTGAGAADPGAGEQSPRARIFTIMAWTMLPMLIVSFGVGFAVAVTLMGVLDVPEGGLLASAGVLGWLAALLVLAIGVIPVALGTFVGRKAVQEGAGRSAKAAVIVNALILTYLVVVQVLQQATG